MKLGFADEIIILALDDKTGRFHPLPDKALDFAISGALLMELAFANRVDADIKNLMIVNHEPLGDVILDRVLSYVADDNELSIQQALMKVVCHAKELRHSLLERLVERGVIERKEHRIFFVLREEVFPIVDTQNEQEVITRIRGVVLEDNIPSPADVVIISLMEACDLSSVVFSDDEMECYYQRVHQIAQMELIGQAMQQAILNIQEAMIEVISYSGF